MTCPVWNGLGGSRLFGAVFQCCQQGGERGFQMRRIRVGQACHQGGLMGARGLDQCCGRVVPGLRQVNPHPPLVRRIPGTCA